MVPGSSEQISMNFSSDRPDSLYRWRQSEAPQQTFYSEANQTTMTVPHLSYGANPEANRPSHHPLIPASMPTSVDLVCGNLPTHNFYPRYS